MCSIAAFTKLFSWSLYEWIYFLVSLSIALGLCWDYFRRAYFSHWFDVSARRWLAKPSWVPDIRVLMTQDPLEHRETFRVGWPGQLLRDATLTALASLLWLAGFRGVRTLETTPSKDNIEIATYLIGFLSVAGAVTKVVYEWRLKARSENRQKWISELRETLAVLIENIPVPGEEKAAVEAKKRAYFAQHGKLELLINPSEKDHRSLVAMIRHIYGFSSVPIDAVPRERLAFGQLDPNIKSDFDTLKSQIVRLANVALKREWERVKYVQ